MSNKESHRQIFKSTAITGGASVITMIVGMAKVKVLALVGGPVGIGLMGLYQSILSTSATFAGCGLASSGVRSLAMVSNDEAKFAQIWRALLIANFVLGLFAMSGIFLLRKPFGQFVVNQPFTITESLLLGIGVVFTLLTGAQLALVQGLRRVGDLAKINIIGAIAGAAAGLIPVCLHLPYASLLFVVLVPVFSTFAGFIFLKKMRLVLPALGYKQMGESIRPLFKLGLPIMAASMVTLVTQLLARGIIVDHIGVEASGHFQAAWSISMTYITFILSAMAADYYPRLTKLAETPKEATKLVNQQAEMALVMATPIIFCAIAFSPFFVEILYSHEFDEAFNLLRWQILGDIVKLLCWPMGYILLAKGKGKLFIAAECVWSASYLAQLYYFIDVFGLDIAGIGFFSSYVLLLGFLTVVSYQLIGYQLSRSNLLIAIFLLAGGGLSIHMADSPYSNGLGAVLVVLGTGYSLFRLHSLVDLSNIFRRGQRG